MPEVASVDASTTAMPPVYSRFAIPAPPFEMSDPVVLLDDSVVAAT